jgi:hypothetical protein
MGTDGVPDATEYATSLPNSHIAHSMRGAMRAASTSVASWDIHRVVVAEGASSVGASNATMSDAGNPPWHQSSGWEGCAAEIIAVVLVAMMETESSSCVVLVVPLALRVVPPPPPPPSTRDRRSITQ